MSGTDTAITVEIAGNVAPSPDAWRDLVRRAAAPNVFMDPAGLAAVGATGYGESVLLCAWQGADDARRLVGVWALERQAIAGLRHAYLAAPPHFYAFVSSPVIDRKQVDAVVAAFFSAIALDPALPKVLRLRYLDGDEPSFAAIAAAAAALPHDFLSDTTRAFATMASGIKKSGSTRKKLRQDWKRLTASGAVELVNERDPRSVRDAFEAFLAMEKRSWKGANGTALLCDAGDAAFTRAFIAALADEASASVALLRLDGRAIAAQVVLYCGTMAYTWKTAYDAACERYSPGALLVDQLSEALFASGAVTAIESCSPDGGFMATLWSGRRRTVDLLVDLSGRRSLAFALLAMGVRGYAGAKAARNRLRTWITTRRAGRRKPETRAPSEKAA